MMMFLSFVMLFLLGCLSQGVHFSGFGQEQAYDRKKLMLFVTPSFGFHLNVFFPTIVPL